jgi:ABC-type polar amino acid transport system ATPase subunit
MVFQGFELFPHLNVLRNLSLPQILVRKLPQSRADEISMEFLSKVNLTDKINSHPNQLSGGQKQRVAIARALCLKPKLMLFDEPTSALDPEMIAEVLNVLRQLAKDGMTMILISHEIGFAREIADTVIFYENGKIIEKGPAVEILDTASHPRTVEFLSKVLK